jgi:two-component sensor histidine kinase
MEAKSLACTPVISLQGLRGLFVVANEAPRRFDGHALSLLSSCADLIAIAFQGAALQQQAQQQMHRLSKLSEVSETLASTKNPSKSADLLLRFATEIFNAPMGLVWLLDPETEELALAATHELAPEEWAISRVKSGEDLPGLAVQSGHALMSADITRDGRCLFRPQAREKGLGPAIVAPLISQGRTIGVLSLYRKGQERFTENDKRLFTFLASNAAIAIENAHLSAEVRRRSEFVSAMMNEVNHQMRNSLQVVSGLLSMEVQRAPTRPAEEVVRRALSHIQVVAAVQDLIREPDLYRVDIKEVAIRVAKLGDRLRERKVEIGVAGTRVMLSSQRAVSVALVIRELVDNALRHGLADATAGRICLGLSEGGGEVVLQVSDNGIGAPRDFDPGLSHGLGLRIVRGLIEEDLGGSVEFASKNGFVVRASFPNPA